MGIREWTNKNQKAASGVAAGALLLAIGAIAYQVYSSRQRYPSDVPNAYFTVDDGKTYFVDKASRITPFDFNGTPAVRAYVFAGVDGKRFVGYLERYTEDSRKSLAAGKPVTANLMRFGREIKRPGDNKWVKTGDPKTEGPVQDIRPPNGGDPSLLVMIDP